MNAGAGRHRLGQSVAVVWAAAALVGCSGSRPENSCSERDISPLRGKEGSCVSGRNHYFVANRGHSLRLPGAAVRLGDVEVFRVVPRGDGSDARIVPANEYFVVVTLWIRNRHSSPLDWRRRVVRRAVLVAEGLRYFGGGGNAEEVERNGPWTAYNQLPITPGVTERRVVAFDVPANAASGLALADSAFIFAVPTRPSHASAGTTLGVFRLSGRPAE